MDLSEKDVLAYFSGKGNRFTNGVGMQLGYTGEVLWTDFVLCDHDHGPVGVSIATEDIDLLRFIEGFQLNKVADIDQLAYTNSWMRYLNGEAEISVAPLELEATLNFKIHKYKTIVFSMDLHFYDEVYKHLTLPEDFYKYLDDNERQLWAASENQYRQGGRG